MWTLIRIVIPYESGTDQDFTLVVKNVSVKSVIQD